MTQSHDRNKDKESGTNLVIICLRDTMCSVSLRSILFYYDLKAPAQYCIGKAMYITTEDITTNDVRTYAWVRRNYVSRTGPLKPENSR